MIQATCHETISIWRSKEFVFEIFTAFRLGLYKAKARRGSTNAASPM
jgi:hypothetical protein